MCDLSAAVAAAQTASTVYFATQRPEPPDEKRPPREDRADEERRRRLARERALQLSRSRTGLRDTVVGGAIGGPGAGSASVSTTVGSS